MVALQLLFWYLAVRHLMIVPAAGQTFYLGLDSCPSIILFYFGVVKVILRQGLCPVHSDYVVPDIGPVVCLLQLLIHFHHHGVCHDGV